MNFQIAGAAHFRSIFFFFFFFFLLSHHYKVSCVCWSTRAGILLLMCTRKCCVKAVSRPDSSPPALPSPWTLPPFWPRAHPPQTRQPSSLWDSCGTLVNRNSSQPCWWPGHAQPSPWVCECLAWYVRPSSGRHRKWARRGGAEKSHAVRSERAPHKLRQNPFFRLEVRG